ncbi:hypothetical protein BpHYR1_003073 [Brachionus plicatilis]|uniref:Uncharacterized protein n=1 Tax=Brachionus plicatilis TaxID=10195 RepID=A0A3M7SEV2_BRAPC|nr:hypothetical protein BpHYR1_003073 [Brachionus plicatilis]
MYLRILIKKLVALLTIKSVLKYIEAIPEYMASIFDKKYSDVFSNTHFKKLTILFRKEYMNNICN